MDHKEISKKKNDLLKSIMSHPKLSRTLKEAMAAPIGSTKREQAKSVLSVMKKLSGLKYDGMGGPTPVAPQPTSQLSVPNDYSNMMIFPAAPSFKTNSKTLDLSSINLNPTVAKSSNPFTQSSASSQSVSNSGSMTSPFSFSSPTNFQKLNPPSTIAPAVASSPVDFSSLGRLKSVVEPVEAGVNPNSLFSSTTELPYEPKKYNAFLPTVDKTNPNATKPSTTTHTPVGVLAPVGGVQTSGTQTGGAQTGGTQTSGAQSGGVSTQYSNLSSASPIKSRAQAAVNEQTGAGLFAYDIANEKFGGSLDAYVNKLDEKIKSDFNLDDLETELSNKKAMKDNLVPTLTQYITGKDQYLKFIDSIIDQTEGNLLKQDMGNPAVANSYNNYLNYLYTLKGRQTQRYGNYLNSAIADYNADLERTQSNYDNVYKNYTDAVTRKATMAQNEYNTLYTTMSDLYTNLENAPTKRANLEALNLQNKANALIIAQNALGQVNSTNPKYLADVKTYIDHITDKDGNLAVENLGAAGLAGFFGEIAYQGGDPQAAIKAINNAMATSIKNSNGDFKTVDKLRTLVNDLSSVEGGSSLASMISPSLSKTAYPIVSDYVLGNLGNIKSAANSLVGGKSSWFSSSPSGLNDKDSWIKNNSNVDSGILNNLYDVAKKNITPGSTYEKNPSTFTSTLFQGNTDQAVADNVTANLMSAW